MFTGLIETVGTWVRLEGGRFEVAVPTWPESWEPIQLGESVAVSGVCLTVIATNPYLAFDLSEETLARTSLGRRESGAKLNLERSCRVTDRLGGHWVQGHVDTVGELAAITQTDTGWIYRFVVEPGWGRYLIDKGSVTVEGISLTAVDPALGAFDVWVIPHTRRMTNLEALIPGDSVNLEFDVLAKYVEQLLASR